jgi:phosphoserine phosphatase RsbU/P
VAQLGGDLYDIVQHPDGRVGIVIADVSGKGLEAAVFTAMTKYTLRAFASEDPGPGSALRRANDSMVKVSGEWGFVTAIYGLLDPWTGSITVANAGHPPCLLVRASGEYLELRSATRSLPLGIVPDVEYMECEDALETGDVLVGYTDGVVEARRDGEPYEAERLAEVIKAARHLTPEEIARAIYESVLEYGSGSLQDDIALIVIKREEV